MARARCRWRAKQITLINPYGSARPFSAGSKTDASGATITPVSFPEVIRAFDFLRVSLDTKTLYVCHNAQISGSSCLLRGHVLRVGFHKFICACAKKVYDFSLTKSRQYAITQGSLSFLTLVVITRYSLFRFSRIMEKYRNNPSNIPNCTFLALFTSRTQNILILSGRQLRALFC